ncbi:hypothetical protein [Sinorhizobium sojae]|uniref:hypothetical protein n=1 Tax=Sinorhizobium sojae TaxID=716925 RepID=UPI0005566A2B|nr:hypothetical protein [Sinorhizobium sojae]
MKRRGFLGFLGGAAAAGPALAKQAADPVLRQAGFPMGGEVAGAALMPAPAPPAGAISKAIRWIRKQGIPAWKMREISQRANYERRYGLDPDLACLVSVSPGWKARTQRSRNLERMIEESVSRIGHHQERHGYLGKLQEKFGIDADWYD